MITGQRGRSDLGRVTYDRLDGAFVADEMDVATIVDESRSSRNDLRRVVRIISSVPNESSVGIDSVIGTGTRDTKAHGCVSFLLLRQRNLREEDPESRVVGGRFSPSASRIASRSSPPSP